MGDKSPKNIQKQVEQRAEKEVEKVHHKHENAERNTVRCRSPRNAAEAEAVAVAEEIADLEEAETSRASE